MDILDRLNLRPMPVFDAAGDKGGGAGDGAAPKTALEAGGEGDKGGQGEADKGGADKGGEQRQAAPAIPENWRDMLAGDDEGLKNELSRVKDFNGLGKRFKDMREKLSKGLDPNEPPPEDGEKLKEWRAARGIPDTATGYKVPDSIKDKVQDVDKPVLDGFFEFMHKHNATQKELGPAIEFYFGMEEAAAADRAEADKVHMKEATGTLKEMWGVDFKANSEIAKRAAMQLVPDVNFYDARLPDGRLIGNVPEFSDLLVQLGLMKWGEGAYESGKGGSDAVTDELEGLRAEMKADIKKWRASPAKQQRYQELLEQKERRVGR